MKKLPSKAYKGGVLGKVGNALSDGVKSLTKDPISAVSTISRGALALGTGGLTELKINGESLGSNPIKNIGNVGHEVAKGVGQGLTEGFGALTGANAARKAAMDAASDAKAQALKDQQLADQMAKQGSADSANIYLGTGRRGKSGGYGGGSSGTQTSQGTGTQNF